MKKQIAFVLISLFLVSCNSDKIMDTKTSLPDTGWSYQTIPAFEFIVDDIDICYDVALNLQVTEEYLYKNVYLIIHLRDPDGIDNSNRINLDLMTPDGKWLGSGSANLKSYQIPIREDLCFEKTGRYIIGIEQNMRDSVLQHVNYAGIAITKGNPVF